MYQWRENSVYQSNGNGWTDIKKANNIAAIFEYINITITLKI
jgi:hypothetical protein